MSPIQLNTLRPTRGAKKRSKVIGRGPGSGHGKTSGKGGKGQTARSGGTIPPGFEGGQMPLLRRTPKRGMGRGTFHKRYAIVNLQDLARAKGASEITPDILRQLHIVKGRQKYIKLLGDGDLPAGPSFTVKIHAVSEGARKKIESAGGTIVLLDHG